MKEFKVVFYKGGLNYETYWKAESEIHAVLGIEEMFTQPVDYGSVNPQNAVISVEEIKGE